MLANRLSDRKLFWELAVLLAAAGLLLASCAGPQPAAPITAASAAPPSPTTGADIQPSATPAAVYAVSGGVEMTLPADRCMDLDNGSLASLDDTTCDFGIAIPPDGGSSSLNFIPLTYASFDFTDVFWSLPDPQTCSLTASYSSAPAQINPEGGYYVCYQTDQGHWGMIMFRELTAQGLTFYWITYRDQADLIAREPAVYPGLQSTAETPETTQTSLPEPVHNQASNMWVLVDQGLDLDSGAIVAGWSGSDDIVVGAGEVDQNGRLLNLQIEPVGRAAVQGGAGLEQAPRPADCSQTDQYTTLAVTVSDASRYRCFQTAEGRQGYLFIHEVNPGVGVRLDWVTWPEILELAVEPGPSPTALESGAAVKVVVPAQVNGVKTYPPGWQISFTWQLSNTGKVTWNTRYALVLARGTAMGGPEKKWIPYPITNGMTVRMALNLTMPEEPGAYLAEYWLVDDSGRRFGIGENGSHPLQLILNAGQPGLTLAEGQGVQLAPGACFDLDTGYPAIDDPACDFSVGSAADTRSLQFFSSQTAFDFITPLETAPTLGRCKLADLSSGTRTVSLENWYVCFKTQQGRYGWLKIVDPSSQGLLFDWKTYR